MKHLLIAVLLLSFSFSYSQEEIWSLDDIDKNASIIQTDDGMVLVIDKNSLRSVQPRTGEINWTVSDIKDLDELVLMKDYPYLKNTGSNYTIIDNRNGELISHHTERTYIEKIDELTDQGKLLFNLKSDKKDVVEILDIRTNNSWSTKIADKIKGNGLLSIYESADPIVTSSGKILIFRKEAFHILDLSSGEILTQVELDDSYKLLSVTADKSAFLIHWDNKMLKAFSTETGKLLWETKNKNRYLEVLNAGPDNNDWLVLDKKQYYIYGINNNTPKTEGKWKSEPEFLYTTNNRLFAGIKKDLVEFDKSNLEIINSKTFDHNVKSLSEVNGTTIITTKYVNEINLDDFNLVYPYKNDLPFLITDIIDSDDFVLYVKRTTQKIEVSAINNNGEEIWNYGSLSTNPPSIDILNDKILIITDTKMAMLNAADGEKAWKNNLSLKPGFTYALNEKTNNLGLFNGKKVSYIDLNTGSLHQFEDKVKFKDFDTNQHSPLIAMLDNGIFLKGSNSIAYFDLDGKLLYNNHYRKSDNTSTLMKLAGATMTVGAIASGNAGQVMTVTSNGETIHKGGMVDGLNDNNKYANQLKARRQRNANRGSLAIPYVFTKQDNGDRGLIFFDMTTADEKYTITMTEKEPEYILDEYEKIIFYHDTTEKKIKAFSLK